MTPYRTHTPRFLSLTWWGRLLCPLGFHKRVPRWREHTNQPSPVCNGLPDLHHHLYWRCAHCQRWLKPLQPVFSSEFTRVPFPDLIHEANAFLNAR